MSGETYTCKPLAWDTEYFGIRSGRIDLWEIINEQDEKKILDFSRDYDFVTICNHANIPQNNLFLGTRTSAYLTDVNVQFLLDIQKSQVHEVENVTITERMSPNPRILEIAASAFRYSRFFNDPRLPVDKARGIYHQWVTNAFDKENKYFVMAQENNDIQGFVLVSIDDTTVVIELIAVDESYRGQHVGTRLLAAVETFAKKSGCSAVRVGTQIDNITAIRFYTGYGFRMTNIASMYHLWAHRADKR